MYSFCNRRQQALVISSRTAPQVLHCIASSTQLIPKFSSAKRRSAPPQAAELEVRLGTQTETLGGQLISRFSTQKFGVYLERITLFEKTLGSWVYPSPGDRDKDSVDTGFAVLPVSLSRRWSRDTSGLHRNLRIIHAGSSVFQHFPNTTSYWYRIVA